MAVGLLSSFKFVKNRSSKLINNISLFNSDKSTQSNNILGSQAPEQNEVLQRLAANSGDPIYHIYNSENRNNPSHISSSYSNAAYDRLQSQASGLILPFKHSENAAESPDTSNRSGRSKNSSKRLIGSFRNLMNTSLRGLKTPNNNPNGNSFSPWSRQKPTTVYPLFSPSGGDPNKREGVTILQNENNLQLSEIHENTDSFHHNENDVNPLPKKISKENNLKLERQLTNSNFLKSLDRLRLKTEQDPNLESPEKTKQRRNSQSSNRVSGHVSSHVSGYASGHVSSHVSSHVGGQMNRQISGHMSNYVSGQMSIPTSRQISSGKGNQNVSGNNDSSGNIANKSSQSMTSYPNKGMETNATSPYSVDTTEATVPIHHCDSMMSLQDT